MSPRKIFAQARVIFPLSIFAALLVFADHDDPPQQPLPSNLHVEELALRAFELVEHQVREATMQSGDGWASQPGAIRTFRQDGSTSRIYKLYSAPDLLAGSSAEAIADLPANWNSFPTRFVDLNAPEMNDGNLEFPIADPRADAEGFAVSESINGVSSTSLPMPVQWIYLLQDGTRGYLDDDNRFIGSVIPTSSNPIVGRIAFWADDDTCKVNINTASEGVHWDIPRTDTIEDRGLARSQPTSGEFQRHPGHPAMVCLSSVLFPGQRIGTPEGGVGQMQELPLQDAQTLWRIGNGTGSGGSEAGTRNIAEASGATAEPSDYTPYDSHEEILSRAMIDDPTLIDRVRRGKFFLTSNSNAPELTTHDYPRISVWPQEDRINFDVGVDFDRMVSEAYRFERRNSVARHTDYYGLGTNHEVLSLLKAHTSRAVPGFGGNSIANKYGAGSFSERDQVLTSMMDHIRMTNTGDLPDRRAVFTSTGQVTSSCMCGGTIAHLENFNLTSSPDPYGGGRIFTISEVALVFHCTGWRDTEGNSGGDDLSELLPGTKRIEVALLAEAFCPAHGHAFISPETSLKLAGSGSIDSSVPPITINSQPLAFQNAPSLKTSSSPTAGGHGGADLFLPDFPQFGASPDPEPMIWLGDFTIPINDTEIDFSMNGELLQLLIFDTETTDNINDATQSIRLDFPDATLPAPGIPNTVRNWFQRMRNVSNGAPLSLDESDTVRSLSVSHGDYRLVACTRAVKPSVFQPHPDYADSTKRFAHTLLDSDGDLLRGASVQPMIADAPVPESLQHDMAIPPNSNQFAPDLVTQTGAPSAVDPAVTGDFDNGYGSTRDGPYMNAPTDVGTDYFDDQEALKPLPGVSLYAPNRISAGPGMFGSIPSGVRSGAPWRTLLFRPDPEHFGAYSTPDHLWLDLFRLPKPLPYRNGNSQFGQEDWKGDTFSSDGKINLNYQILPFAHIHRSTALHAALKSEKLVAIPNTAGSEYKSPGGADSYRHFIDAEQTLQQWEDKFATGRVFRTASEICDQYLVPEQVSLGAKVDGDYPQMRSFWAAHKLTGDNTKERPYASLYQHFTTRSNSYEVHVLAQLITKSAQSPADIFNPNVDAVGEEYRGVGTLRRWLAPEDSNIPNYLDDPLALPLSNFYQTGLFNISPSLVADFKITQITLNIASQPTITWNSAVGETYIIQRSSDLISWTEVTTLPSQGATTSFTDRSTSSRVRLHYRIVRQ